MTTSIQRRISIVIPCLNDAVLLEQCLSSIVAQTLQPEEVIVVDNGSTDNSVEVANRMGARVVHEPLQGITWASAAGYNSARGDLIVRFDADCVIPPDHLSQVNAIWNRTEETPGCTIVALTGTGSFDIPGRMGEWLALCYLGAYRWSTKQALGHYPIFGSNSVISRQWWEDVKDQITLSETFVHEDMYFSFFVRPHETVWFEKNLKLIMHPRALMGVRQSFIRLVRGFYTIKIAWKREPVHQRLESRRDWT